MMIMQLRYQRAMDVVEPHNMIYDSDADESDTRIWIHVKHSRSIFFPLIQMCTILVYH